MPSNGPKLGDRKFQAPSVLASNQMRTLRSSRETGCSDARRSKAEFYH
jgi:hypothetical protein